EDDPRPAPAACRLPQGRQRPGDRRRPRPGRRLPPTAVRRRPLHRLPGPGGADRASFRRGRRPPAPQLRRPGACAWPVRRPGALRDERRHVRRRGPGDRPADRAWTAAAPHQPPRRRGQLPPPAQRRVPGPGRRPRRRGADRRVQARPADRLRQPVGPHARDRRQAPPRVRSRRPLPLHPQRRGHRAGRHRHLCHQPSPGELRQVRPAVPRRARVPQRALLRRVRQLAVGPGRQPDGQLCRARADGGRQPAGRPGM
ncbi:MAG: Predicted periplasmic protein, partial [uncultured Sphingomonas sp.]